MPPFIDHQQALSDFADYVQKQQALQRPTNAVPIKPSNSKQPVAPVDHAELDIIDSLGLEDVAPPARLKELLLDTGQETALEALLAARLDEGYGEALFDVGTEDNGDSMSFSMQDWSAALTRIGACATKLKADTKLLISKNVGSDVDIDTQSTKDKSCSGKVMIRRIPQNVDDVIETRIAVVGNG